jgi:antitoxin CptB
MRTADRLNRIRFRAWRRGFREADLILGPFADACAASLYREDLTAFEALLEQPDHEIYAWIVGAAPTPSEFDTAVLARLRAFSPVSDGGPVRGG